MLASLPCVPRQHVAGAAGRTLSIEDRNQRRCILKMNCLLEMLGNVHVECDYGSSSQRILAEKTGLNSQLIAFNVIFNQPDYLRE